MEIFVDFGLFELLALTGVVSLGRYVAAHRVARGISLATAIAAPALVCAFAPTELLRWTAAIGLAASIVNASAALSRASAGRADPS